MKPEELNEKVLEQVSGGTADSVDRIRETKIINLLKSRLDLNDPDITGESSIIVDLGAGSLDVVDIVQALEEEFNIRVSDSRMASLRTVRDLIDLVKESTEI